MNNNNALSYRHGTVVSRFTHETHSLEYITIQYILDPNLGSLHNLVDQITSSMTDEISWNLAVLPSVNFMPTALYIRSILLNTILATAWYTALLALCTIIYSCFCHPTYIIKCDVVFTEPIHSLKSKITYLLLSCCDARHDVLWYSSYNIEITIMSHIIWDDKWKHVHRRPEMHQIISEIDHIYGC